MERIKRIYSRILGREITDFLFIDFETKSEIDVSNVGAHRYSMHSSTEMILCAYAFNNEPVRVKEEIPERIWSAILNPSVIKIAHNAEFDMCVCKNTEGIPIRLNEWFDTSYQAAYFSYPRKLAHLAEVLETSRKNSNTEMLMFASPYRAADTEAKGRMFFKPSPALFNGKDTHPVEWSIFVDYAKADVNVMRECFLKMSTLPHTSYFTMLITFEMNFNGVPWDLEFAARIAEKAKFFSENAEREAKETYRIENLRSVPQVQEALRKCGVFLNSLDVKKRNGVTHPILDLKDQASGAAFSKIPKAVERICKDGLLRGELLAGGAHTDRWSSRGVQIQNLTRIKRFVDLSLNADSYEHLKMFMRLCVHAGENSDLHIADLSQIEARIVANLSDCKWRMDAFKRGEDIYARSAEKMYGLPPNSVTKDHPRRQDGKTSELAFGFGGGANAILRSDSAFYHREGVVKCEDINRKWKAANPEIKKTWNKLENGWRNAMETGNSSVVCGTVTIYFQFDGKSMRIILPSGRALYYRKVFIAQGEFGGDIYYTDISNGLQFPKRQKMWGGTILHNITQAIAKDVLIENMMRVKKEDVEQSMKIRCTVHDEIWYTTTKKRSAMSPKPLDILLNAMRIETGWFPGLVTNGDGFTSERYIK